MNNVIANLIAKGMSIPAIYVSSHLNADALISHLDYDSYAKLTTVVHNSQTMPRFQFIPIDSTAINMAGKSVRTVIDAKLNTEFDSLVNKWRDETFFISSLGKQFTHPAYVRIMAMGKEGLPLVLRELQNSNDNWFYALKFMAGEDAATGIENFDDAKAAWLEWGYKHNYI